MPPDLVVDAINLPPTVTAPCPTPVDVLVRNAGSDPAPFPFDVCLQAAAGAEEPFLPEQVRRVGQRGEGAGLAPNQTVTVGFEVAFPCQPQSWVTAEADCRHVVPANVRSSPRATALVPGVALVPWLFADVRVGLQDSNGIISWDPAQLCANLAVAVEVTVTNRGCASSPASTTELTVTEDASGQIASVSWPTASITPGGRSSFLHVLKLPSPPPAEVVIAASADAGRVVAGQCDIDSLDVFAGMPVSPGAGSPLLTLTVDAPIVPGEAPRVSWSVENDCSELRDVTATVLFGAHQLYQSAAIPIAPLGQAGEQHETVSVPAAAAAGLWTVGQQTLELHVTSLGAPGTTFNSTAELRVIPETPRFTWAWSPPVDPQWHEVYSVAGKLTNPSKLTAMTASAVTITETGAETPAVGAMPVSAPSAPIPTGSSAPLGGSSPLFQVWQWIDPITFQFLGPISAVFKYVAGFTLTDEFGNAYPPATSTLFVTVTVPLTKQLCQSSASDLLIGSVIMAAAAAALALVEPIVAAFVAVAAVAAWGLAIQQKAQADDPPVPDFDYHERVEVRPASYALPVEGAPSWAPAMASVIALLARVRAASEALALIHPKILGARIDGDAEALRMQADDYRSALARLDAATAEVPNAIALLLEEVDADEHWSRDWSEAAVESLRSGKTVDAGREVWRENDLPEEAFDDLLRRLPHLDALPPPAEVLGSVARQTEELAAALRKDAEAVLEAPHAGNR